MNGTIYDEIKKNGNSKKKEKLKFIVTIFSTNLLIAVLCLSLGNSNPIPLSAPKIPIKIIHPHFKMIILPLTTVIDIDHSAKETPVTLMTKSKTIVISKAYLHEEIKNEKNTLTGLTQFKIEIPEDELLKLSAHTGNEMIAMPELQLPSKKKMSVNKRASQYEVDL